MRVRSIARRLVGIWLMVDGVTTGLWFAGVADSLGGRDTLSVVVMGARVLTAALSGTAGWLIAQQRPQGAALGRVAVALIALFSVITAWTGVLPTNLDPARRVTAAMITTAAAAGAMIVLRQETRGVPQ
jgi:hypothetical protein